MQKQATSWVQGRPGHSGPWVCCHLCETGWCPGLPKASTERKGKGQRRSPRDSAKFPFGKKPSDCSARRLATAQSGMNPTRGTRPWVPKRQVWEGRNEPDYREGFVPSHSLHVLHGEEVMAYAAFCFFCTMQIKYTLVYSKSIFSKM